MDFHVAQPLDPLNRFGALIAQENVEYALNLKAMPGREARKEAARSMELVGLSDRRRFLPRDLSGGQNFLAPRSGAP